MSVREVACLSLTVITLDCRPLTLHQGLQSASRAAFAAEKKHRLHGSHTDVVGVARKDLSSRLKLTSPNARRNPAWHASSNLIRRRHLPVKLQSTHQTNTSPLHLPLSQHGEANHWRKHTHALKRSEARKTDASQMLRRGLVLDLSVAFGRGHQCDSQFHQTSERILTMWMTRSRHRLWISVVVRYVNSDDGHPANRTSHDPPNLLSMTNGQMRSRANISAKASTSHRSASGICSTPSWRTRGQRRWARRVRSRGQRKEGVEVHGSRDIG